MVNTACVCMCDADIIACVLPKCMLFFYPLSVICWVRLRWSSDRYYSFVTDMTRKWSPKREQNRPDFGTVSARIWRGNDPQNDDQWSLPSVYDVTIDKYGLIEVKSGVNCDKNLIAGRNYQEVFIFLIAIRIVLILLNALNALILLTPFF